MSSVTFKTAQTVKSLKGPLSELVPEYNDVIKQINDSLLVPVDVISSKAVHTQTTRTDSTPRYSDPLQVGPIREPQRFVITRLQSRTDTLMKTQTTIE